MKFKFPAQILASAFLMGASSSVNAASYTWSAAGGNWNTASNWRLADGSATAVAPTTDGDIAILNVGNTERIVTLNVSPTLSVLGIGYAGGGNYRFATTTPQTITLRKDPSNEASVPGLYVGFSEGSNSPGILTTGSGVTINLFGGKFFVGVGASRGTNGSVQLDNGSTLNIGTSSNRTDWMIGSNGTHVGTTKTAIVSGTTGSTFSAYASNLVIGVHNGTSDMTSGGIDYRSNGTLDLTAVTVNAFDVSGNITIGRGANHKAGSFGTLSLGKIDAKVGGHLQVGDSVARSSGVVNLLGTHMEVGGNVLLDTTGHISVTLDGESAGLSLAALSTLTINAHGASAGDLNAGYHITFSELSSPLSLSDIYYGFAWEGDHLTTVNTLVGNHAITWTNLMTGYNPTAFYDLGTNTTYIGVVPEPGSVALAIGGLLFAGIALKQRRNR